ncbi:MAG: hypothetical protein H6853_03570 [Rhodospirillales bacterium]|nr:hypothetical protein [Alphaproteobacteria bacterium]USO04361.1 MAG: hypothetical protein H6853_03570 [Rhodospirillales bacterium]
MKNILFLLSFFMLFVPPAAGAEIKDSYYFMRDDGEQSPEEMEEEALYVFETCDTNVYQKNYFDCACIAGAFLKERERLGSIAPQEEIVHSLYRNGPPECTNTSVIAGEAYQNCLRSSAIFREFKKDNEEYCSCVGKTAAKKFAQMPYLRTDYIEQIHVDSMVLCNERDEDGNPLPRD